MRTTEEFRSRKSEVRMGLVFLAAGLLAPTAFGQAGVIAQGNVNGPQFAFYWQTRLEPSSPPLSDQLGYGAGYNTADGSVFRVMIDRAHRSYFGYSVRVEPLPQNMYRLTFQPLHLTDENFKQLHMDDPGTWNQREIGTPAPHSADSSARSPDTVHALDVVAVDLLLNRQSGQKVTDYVVIQPPTSVWSFRQLDAFQRELSYPNGPTRDFSVEDGTFHIADPQLRINGKLRQQDGLSDVVSPFIWIQVPGRGRYILTLSPGSEGGFQKAGEVRGTVLNFTFGTDQVTITSLKPIVSADAAFNLYVLLDPTWKSGSSAASIGAMDRSALAKLLNQLGRRN
jgi:hypothetical protein